MKTLYHLLLICLCLGVTCACGEDTPVTPVQEITPGGEEPEEPEKPEEPENPQEPVANVNANDSVDGMAYVTDYSMPHLNAAHISMQTQNH